MPWLLTRGERRRRNRLQGGRLHLGTVADIKSERWPTSSRNRWPACVGIRTQCPQHVFQVLTKRAERMLEIVGSGALPVLPNVWLGVSCGRPAYLSRLDALRQ